MGLLRSHEYRRVAHWRLLYLSVRGAQRQGLDCPKDRREARRTNPLGAGALGQRSNFCFHYRASAVPYIMVFSGGRRISSSREEIFFSSDLGAHAALLAGHAAGGSLW